ncbi:MAG TPA: hypothetical protein V6C96_00480 [Vampirovibrionales bacterium]
MDSELLENDYLQITQDDSLHLAQKSAKIIGIPFQSIGNMFSSAFAGTSAVVSYANHLKAIPEFFAGGAGRALNSSPKMDIPVKED